MIRDITLEGGTATIYSDARSGGDKQWTLGNPKDARMRVPEEILDCVGFLCTRRRGGGLDYIGNCFFVETTAECNEEPGYHYLVTAKHVVDYGLSHGGLLLRLNTTDGGVDTMRLSDEWEYPNEDTEKYDTDLAVLRFIPNRDDFVYKALPSYSLIRKDRTPIELYQRDIGVGEDLAVASLFHDHHGKKRNRPIVRFGTIAAMPDEPIKDSETKKLYWAYLAELRSISGLSGAPVFLLVEIMGDNLRGPKRNFDAYFFVLGVLRGHWYDNVNAIEVRLTSHGKVDINIGIAAVTPSQYIVNIMNGDKMKKAR